MGRWKQMSLPMLPPAQARREAPPSIEPEVRGLTFFRGWAEAIVRPVPSGATAPCPKRIENRSKALPTRHVGTTWIAIRTGLRIDREGLRWMREAYGYPWLDDEARLAPPGLLIGAMRIGHVVHDEVERPWYRGSNFLGKLNFGWVIDEVVDFEADPIAFTPSFCLGLFRLDEAASAAVRSRVVAAAERQRGLP